MKFPSLFKIQEKSSFSPLPWPLQPCGNLKTLSYRYENNHNIFNCESFSNYNVDECIVERVIEGLKTEKQRLFFEPRGETSSILEVSFSSSSSSESDDSSNGLEIRPFNDSCVVTAVDSMDPLGDFKKSMEEMVEANEEIKCEKSLQELLNWYLKANEKNTHRYIIGAFYDLLVSYSTTSPSTPTSAITSYNNSHSFTNSPFSFCSSSPPPCLSLLQVEDEITPTE
ncbi:hypothetical protein HAX54_009899 [Datura stramonium]|uniref:Transcription repressor n=1 Tax=Datura stramonium TaxID=4076 RepID=A0ABS8RWE6_DATST|nr:hypothetical protein [Datura stramonium]